jgi:hypothetical protein
MDIQVGPSGKLALMKLKQQVWLGEDPDIMQVSVFAGQEMMLIQKSDDEPEVYELHYLGFRVTGFMGVDSAKSNAPDFARKTLSKMTDLIKD